MFWNKISKSYHRCLYFLLQEYWNAKEADFVFQEAKWSKKEKGKFPHPFPSTPSLLFFFIMKKYMQYQDFEFKSALIIMNLIQMCFPV